jgi:NAD(P)-dependent dehydrogenase (short-subunit alcohol dehydrogenase family)
VSKRTVVVTGAGRGIGRAIALRLAQSGWRVYGGVRTDVAAKVLAEESELIMPVEFDALVNNAGVSTERI